MIFLAYNLSIEWCSLMISVCAHARGPNRSRFDFVWPAAVYTKAIAMNACAAMHRAFRPNIWNVIVSYSRKIGGITINGRHYRLIPLSYYKWNIISVASIHVHIHFVLILIREKADVIISISLSRFLPL